MMIRSLAVAAFMLATLPAHAGEAARAADRFAHVAGGVDGISCKAQHNSRTIICIVQTDDRGLDEVASALVMQARAYDLSLVGWSLMLANPNDYVVSRNF